MVFVRKYFFQYIIVYSRNYSQSVKSNLEKILLNMPKSPKHLGEIRNQRLKNKEKLSKFVPGRVTLQVLGTGAKGSPRSLYIFTDQSRYLFNCGEGTQRLAHELKLKLAKLENIFITQPTWQNIGGLPGITLTMQDVGVPCVNIHGPSGMREMFSAAKKFVLLKNLKLIVTESNSNDVYEDNVLKVRNILLNRQLEQSSSYTEEDLSNEKIEVGTNADLKNEETKLSRRTHQRARSISSEDSNSSSSGKLRKKRRHKHRKNRTRSLSLDVSPNSTINSDKDFVISKDKGIVTCYICQLQPRPGALNLEKCVALGIPPGPLLGRLKSGEDVTLHDGTIIKSEQVCEPDDPGPIFIVVDCPTVEYITSLVNNNEFKKYQKFASNDDDVAYTVIHFTPSKIIEDPRYQAWIDLFLPCTKHLILNDRNSCMGSMSVHRIQHKLNMIHPKIFPLLGDDGTEFVEDYKEQNKLKTNSVYGSYNITSANTLTAVHLRPKKGLDRSEEIKLNPEEYINETLCIEGFKSALEELKSKLLSKKSQTNTKEYPKILFLGTGSCIPNKTRNTSGILLELEAQRNILLDCGEGTYGQIVRFFGKNKSDEILASIDAIYISHLHADHHIGTIGILQGRRRALKNLTLRKKPVILLAPVQLFPWLSFYNRYFENIKDEFDFISNSDLLYSKPYSNRENYHRVIDFLNIRDVSTCYVKHCPNAFGIAFTLEDNSKVTYSGDTMPCEDLVNLGMGSDLLIHEATMEDDLEHEAVIKMHSTTTQAIHIGKQMNAKHILLTHFSQRYAKLPRFNESFVDNVGIAFDNMQVTFEDLLLLPHFYDALKLMFIEHFDEMENKALKRQLRNEKENDLMNIKQKLKKSQ